MILSLVSLMRRAVARHFFFETRHRACDCPPFCPACSSPAGRSSTPAPCPLLFNGLVVRKVCAGSRIQVLGIRPSSRDPSRRTRCSTQRAGVGHGEVEREEPPAPLLGSLGFSMWSFATIAGKRPPAPASPPLDSWLVVGHKLRSTPMAKTMLRASRNENTTALNKNVSLTCSMPKHGFFFLGCQSGESSPVCSRLTCDCT